jgi:hypothetical protein
MMRTAMWTGRAGAGAPYVVIDAGGSEVGVVVSYDQYVRLLALVVERVEPRLLPPYWRRALEGCLALEGPVSQTPGSGTSRPGRRPGTAHR